ncbi:MAG: hypothetical protein BWY85_02461 [Firmicutes bacterium ADurb.Bin506]|nr:MAG: hypothetical protein BWY85_02461 [Firmicutes bacterium ADurb.Bin506]
MGSSTTTLTLSDPEITSDRLNSVWGQMGVTSSTSMLGLTSGPPAESEYAVEPVGLHTMAPSAVNLA